MSKLSIIRRTLPASFTSTVGRQILKAQKNSPQILFGVGIAGFVGTVVLSSRATLKVEDVLDKASSDLKNVNDVLNNKELAKKHDYTDEDALKDRVYIYIRTATDLTKLYGPTIVCGVVSIAALTKSHTTLTKRNAAIMAAYTGLEQAFSEYRKRVAEQLNPEYERDIFYDAKAVVRVDDTGKAVPEGYKVIGNRAYSQYARFFDEYSKEWQKEPEYNFIFLRAQQNYANDLLLSRGHVFLNDVYDMLGIERSRTGSVVGWVLDREGNGDNYIDFGFMDGNNPRARDFVNGREGSILLDFNVDGLIWDKI